MSFIGPKLDLPEKVLKMNNYKTGLMQVGQ